MNTEFKVDKIKHVAVIMDGNGRWAKNRAHRRVWGHVRGSSIVSDIVERSDDLGVKALTLYAFSTENWSRPQAEVKTLFTLLKKFLLKERARIINNKIKFRVIGDTSNLPEGTKNLIRDLECETKDFEGLKLSFAFGYGGRSEIVNAVTSLIESGDEVSEENISKHMYAPEIGDVDLLIRTGGDQRVSNFLLWQIAYAELFFTQTKWPDFSVEEFEDILRVVEGRERRFGAISEADSLNSTKEMARVNNQQY
jgi:undecaprenyl diphosphate synthase